MCAQACSSISMKVGITNRLVQPWLTAWLCVLDTMFFWVNTYTLLYLTWMCSHLVLALTASQFIMRSACLHILRHKNWRQVDLHLFIFSGVFLWLHSPLLCLHCAQRVCLETGVFSSKETDEQPLPNICSLNEENVLDLINFECYADNFFLISFKWEFKCANTSLALRASLNAVWELMLLILADPYFI